MSKTFTHIPPFAEEWEMNVGQVVFRCCQKPDPRRRRLTIIVVTGTFGEPYLNGREGVIFQWRPRSRHRDEKMVVLRGGDKKYLELCRIPALLEGRRRE